MINPGKDDRTWHVDKRIPLALILVIVIQTGGAFWWASGVQSAIENAKENRDRLELRLTRVELARDDISARLIRLEEKLSGTNSTLDEILRTVRRLKEDPKD